ncbi:DNA polymerase III subunit delta' [uncultured Mailhella sp.]|uniref:DNA polymerase III subunit delta' n=1 Tax=uncultured Mailhella sp. TaxID=1981031 RepID=UPI0025FC9A44|nr:DNA polymerase III subunit delta' [uncultured Mailhella sp.]
MAAARKEGGKASARKSAPEDRLPGVDEARAAFSASLDPELERPRAFLRAMRQEPPQLLHLEGGNASSRVALALWWAALLNCEEQDDEPCLACHSCLRIGADMHPDLFLLDGRAASIKIDEVRALRPVLGEKPHFGRRRVIVLAEAQSLGVEAANSLLKVLEDPSPDTCFVFTAPQRERLLPTLVSRGWVITLPWPETGRALPAELQVWENALARFASEGRGWFDMTQARNGLDAATAQNVVLVGQKALADCLASRSSGPLAGLLRPLPEEMLLEISELFVKCQDALIAQVNPLLALDAMATGLWRAVREGRRGKVPGTP